MAGSCSALRNASYLIKIGARVMRGRKIAQRPTKKRSAPRSLTKERYSRARDEFAWIAGYKDLSIINLDLAPATLNNTRSPGLRDGSKVSAKWNQNPHLTTVEWLSSCTGAPGYGTEPFSSTVRRRRLPARPEHLSTNIQSKSHETKTTTRSLLAVCPPI